MPTGIPTVIRGQLVRIIGHERHLRRTDIRNQRQELLRRISFHIQFRGHHRLQLIYILLTNMTLIWTRMNRNALRAKQLAVHRKALNIRQITPTRITQRSYFINVYTQLCHVEYFEIRCKDTTKIAYMQEKTKNSQCLKSILYINI